jgi:hypothetical protein
MAPSSRFFFLPPKLTAPFSTPMVSRHKKAIALGSTGKFTLRPLVEYFGFARVVPRRMPFAYRLVFRFGKK